MDRAPIVENGPSGVPASRWLRPGWSATHERLRLRLLPSGPDLVRDRSPHGTQPSTPSTGVLTPKAEPSERNSAPLERIAGNKAPLPPRLARSTSDPSWTEPGAARWPPRELSVLRLAAALDATSAVSVPRWRSNPIWTTIRRVWTTVGPKTCQEASGSAKRHSARPTPRIRRSSGRVAQWESARFTRERSVVRNHPRPSEMTIR
jgi:hypothetical protein